MPPAKWIIKADMPAKPRNTGATGPRPDLPLIPGSPRLPGARGLFAGASNKRLGEGSTQHPKLAKLQQHFLLQHQQCPSRVMLPLELSQL